MNMGAGWRVVHLTDRVLLAMKESYEYRRLLGRDGYIKVRIEPGQPRSMLFDKAKAQAQSDDAMVSYRLAMQLIPTMAARDDFRIMQARHARAFGIPGEEPEQRIYRP